MNIVLIIEYNKSHRMRDYGRAELLFLKVIFNKISHLSI